MVKKILIFVFIFCFSFSLTYWSTQNKTKIFYDNFYQKIVEKNNSNQEVISWLESLDKKLDLAIKSSKNISSKESFLYLKKLNLEKLNELKNNIFLQYWTDGKKYDLSKLSWNITILSDNFEYKDEKWKLYSVSFNKYYELTKNTYDFFINKWIWNYKIFKVQNSIILSQDFILEELYSNTDLYNLFLNKLDISTWEYLVLDKGIYYYYDFLPTDVYSFNSKNITLSNLEKYWFYTKSWLIVKSWDFYWFVKNYKKIKLFDEKLILWISNKQNFLKAVSDDYLKFNSAINNILTDIKNKSLEITKNSSSEDQKILDLYKWVINNTKYYNDFTDGNNKVFSWLETFKNWTGVCDWYTKLFLYMLSFSWVDYVEIKTWFSYDSEYFPNFWHAWVKINADYYDPTFDDPNWGEREEYLYYKIPYELMYINRFDWFAIPKNLSNLTLDQRKLLVEKNLYQIYNKYKNYPLAKTIKNKIELWFLFNEELSLDKLSQKIDTIEIINELNVMYFYDWTSKKYIKSINYYPLTNENISWIFKNYNIEIWKLKIWKFISNWKINYWLIYNLTLY